jgi:RNA polymerase sigma-70 factor (ECF subfamily)
MLLELTDAELLAQAACGEEDAFSALYDRRQGGIYRFALQMTGRREVAEEVTQETFIALTRELGRYDAAKGSVAGYLYGIARNLLLRSTGRDRAHVGLDDAAIVPVDGGPLDQMLRSESGEAVRRAVLGLPEAYREAVVLCDLQELSYAEASEVLGCPVGTVRSKLSRGRELLARKLQAFREVRV